MHPDMYLVLLCATNSKILINFFGVKVPVWGFPLGLYPVKDLMVCPLKCVFGVIV